MITISDHVLVFNGKRVDYRPSPNVGGALIPKYIIIHYTAANTAEGAINWMLSKIAKVSAHLHIAKDGNIVQLVPFNRVAWHAGVSEWIGVKMLNSHSIGIELQNNGSEQYPEIQLAILEDVAKVLVQEYNLRDVLGHSDIAPGRKVDPGKYFPMSLFRSAVMASNCVDFRTTTADVNLREGAGTSYKVVSVLKKGTKVEVKEVKDGWATVSVLNSNLNGYVSNQYLT